MRKDGFIDKFWSLIGVTEELLALNYKPGYRPWHVLEIRGSFIYFIAVAGISFMAATFQLIAGIHLTTVFLPISMNFSVAVMAWFIYQKKKNMADATALSYIAAFTFATCIVITRYIYVAKLGWDIALLSYNISVLYATVTIINVFLYNKRLYRLIFYFIFINWIVFIFVAYFSNAQIYIKVLDGSVIHTGFNLLREIFVLIVMAFISTVVYINIPIIAAYEEKTTEQQKIIEEYNLFLAKKIEEKTKELHLELAERKNKENALRKFSAAVQHSPASICITDTKGRIEYVNPRFEEMTGYSLDEVKGKKPEKFLNRNLLQREIEAIIDVIRNGGKWIGEIKNTKKNGEEYWELAAISSIKDDSGKITNYIAVEEDITLRKKIEMELKENQIKLQERNQIIEKEISIAELVQKTILLGNTGRMGRFHVESRQRCVEKIGGDFFAVKNFSDDELSVFIGDISGHGVASSLFLSLLKFITDDLSLKFKDNPHGYIEALNKNISGYMSSYFLTGIYAHIKFNSSNDEYELTFSNGAHPSPVVISAEGVATILESHGSLIGLMEDAEYKAYSFKLHRGDRIFLFTDGLTEMTDPVTNLPLSQSEDFLNIFTENSSSDIGSSLDSIMSILDSKRGLKPYEDDLLLIGISLL
ncbi:MAG TPA: SpoIIE family protein phosphatase [Spirochaetota bacterium]|nr:SpoIIE family protein phosphatase [Spirochaetota bacterium]HOV07512.1 SpoIIE family protein phosphatase [Spirochaetota bacterium]